MTNDEVERRLLRHFLAALAYRTQKAIRGAPDSYADFRVAPTVRTPHELVWHMTGVLGYARTFYTGGTWRPERLSTFAEEVARLHAIMESLGAHLDAGAPGGTTLARLLQGPLSDAMTHAGQLAMLRRLAGDPVPPENFVLADVRADNLGASQPAPVSPDAGWHPDQPPSPGGPRPD